MDFPFACLLLLSCLCVRVESRDIEVVNSGVMKVRREDMAVALYTTVHHHGDRPRKVMATMVECCEKLNDVETDCTLMHLFGQHLGVIQPGSTHNITLLYPNLYGYNRRGSCLIDIWNRGDDSSIDDTNRIRHKIDFDTTIRGGIPDDRPAYIRALYGPEKLAECETVDQDPFDGCNPVDCRSKYLGLRSFYNRKRKRCQKVPECAGNPDKELADVVYVPISNTCKDLEKEVTNDDIIFLINDRYETRGDYLESGQVNIQCHHGEVDVRTGLCVCDKGWTSEPFDPEAYSQGNYVYHMCNRKCHPDNPSDKVPIVIGIVLALAVILSVLICESCDLFTPRYECPDDLFDDDDDEEVTFFQVSGD